MVVPFWDTQWWTWTETCVTEVRGKVSQLSTFIFCPNAKDLGGYRNRWFAFPLELAIKELSTASQCALSLGDILHPWVSVQTTRIIWLWWGWERLLLWRPVWERLLLLWIFGSEEKSSNFVYWVFPLTDYLEASCDVLGRHWQKCSQVTSIVTSARHDVNHCLELGWSKLKYFPKLILGWKPAP